MKKLIIILGLFGLVLNTFGQGSELERDVIKADQQIYIRGDSLGKFVVDNSPATSVLAFNFDYTYNSNTSDSKPGTGLFKLNNASYASVTQIYIDDLDNNSIDKSKFLAVPDTGSYISLITDNGNYVIYQLTGAITDAVGYYKYGVTYVNNNGVISGATTIDIQISNNVGGGGGGAADSLLISSTDTLTLVGDSLLGNDINAKFNTVTVNDTLRTSLIYTDDPFVLDVNSTANFNVQSVFDITASLINMIATGNLSLVALNNLYLNGDDVELQSVFQNTIISNNDTIIHKNDTVFADGSGGSTKNHIKTGTVIVDSVGFKQGDDIYYLGGVRKSQTITYDTVIAREVLEAKEKLIVGNDTATSFSSIDTYTYNSLLFNSVVEDDAHSDGKLQYKKGPKSLTFQNDIVGFDLNIGYESVRTVYNNTGSTISDGRFVRRTGTHINDDRVATIALAGISSKDSTNVWGITTVEIPPDSYGVATVFGDVKNINNQSLSEDRFYCGFAGVPIDTSPPPPYYSICGGEVLYADSDSGIYSVNIETATLDPSPLLSIDTSGLNQTVNIVTTDVYEYLPISDCNIDAAIGFIVDGDSIQIQIGGYYQVVLSMSFQGNPTTEVWHYAAFKNGVALPYKERSTSSSATGDINLPISRQFQADDWVSFKIKNTGGTGDPTIQTIAAQILFLHE